LTSLYSIICKVSEMTRKRYLFLPLIISLPISTISAIIRNDNRIFSLIGGTISLILFPYLIASIIKYRFTFSKWHWNFESKSFLTTFIIVWVIFVLFDLAQSLGL
jgi:hypothetical protein